MGWFSRLLGRRDRSAPARDDAGDAHLVSGLKDDHRELISLYSQVVKAAEQGHYDSIPGQLATFKARLEGHLLTENYRLYGFLEDRLANDRDNAELITDFRREMGGIARQVLRFIRHWQEHGVDESSAARFRQELDSVGAVLSERIEREERDLYPLYEHAVR